MSMDRIYIRDLMIRCIIGVYPEERRDKQDVIINVELAGDFSKAGLTDNLADAVDYKQIKKNIVGLVEKSSFNLIETLAERIAAICLDHPRVVEAKVTVDKPGALRFARSVAFEITRRKPQA
ncbi:MAG: dihydroneopterin aldolase [Kiritimatiellae bacterium]|nr:dihydroneopterin aldolase [Kiritimatiellia bacterium]MDW8459431.1 dihydroneopterin aldolase [Verrucomicrobiota bacterium]